MINLHFKNLKFLIVRIRIQENLKQNFFLLKNPWPEIIPDPDLRPEIIHDPLDRIQNTEENKKKSVKINQCFGFGSERIWYFLGQGSEPHKIS